MVSETGSSKTAEGLGLAEGKVRLRIWEWLRHHLELNMQPSCSKLSSKRLRNLSCGLRELRSHSQLHLKRKGESGGSAEIHQKDIPQYSASPLTSYQPLLKHFLKWNEFLNTLLSHRLKNTDFKKRDIEREKEEKRGRKTNRFLLEKGKAYFQLCLGKHSTRWREEVSLNEFRQSLSAFSTYQNSQLSNDSHIPQTAAQTPAPFSLPLQQKPFLENKKQTQSFQSICGFRSYKSKSSLGELTL